MAMQAARAMPSAASGLSRTWPRQVSVRRAGACLNCPPRVRGVSRVRVAAPASASMIWCAPSAS
jgi:hypothetical protein